MTKLWCSVLGCWENGVTPTAQNTFAGTASIIFMTNSGEMWWGDAVYLTDMNPGLRDIKLWSKVSYTQLLVSDQELDLRVVSGRTLIPPLPWVTPIHCLSEESLQRGIFSQDRRLLQEGVPGHPGGACPTMHYLYVTPLWTHMTVAFQCPQNPGIEHAATGLGSALPMLTQHT